jgi:transcription elongation factor GreB
VRFGAAVEVRAATGAPRTYRIVGVDEAEPAAGLIAFVSPIARALLGRRVGESVSVRTPRGEEEIEIVRVDYSDPSGAPDETRAAGSTVDTTEPR